MRATLAIERARRRYLLLLMIGLACFLPEHFHIGNQVTDWSEFEYGARTIVHLNDHYPYGFHLYARIPNLQTGPPPLYLVAAFQWLPPKLVAFGFGLVMVVAGLGTVAMGESMARSLGITPTSARHKLWLDVAEGAVVAWWSYNAARFPHPDDVLAISLTIATMAVIARRSSHAWWLASLLLGIAIASKPWALGAAPVLYALPRERRAPAVLITLAIIGGLYAPFVLIDHGTYSALAGFRLYVAPTSTLRLLGVHSSIAPGWVRNVQIGLALVLGFVLAARGRWLAVPLCAFAVRVVLDPQVSGYYAFGPMVGSLVLDLTQDTAIPWWTIATGIAEIVVPACWPSAEAAVRLGWFVVVVAVLLLSADAFGRLGLRPWQRRMTSRTA